MNAKRLAAVILLAVFVASCLQETEAKLAAKKLIKAGLLLKVLSPKRTILPIPIPIPIKIQKTNNYHHGGGYGGGFGGHHGGYGGYGHGGYGQGGYGNFGHGGYGGYGHGGYGHGGYGDFGHGTFHSSGYDFHHGWR